MQSTLKKGYFSFNLIFLCLFLTANCPYIHIGPISLSFLIGVVIILSNLSMLQFVIFSNRYLLLFTIFSVVSLLLSPVAISYNTLYVIFQIIYWFLLSVIIVGNIRRINFFYLARAVQIVIVLTTIIYVLNDTVLNDSGGSYDNTISYIIISIWPLGLYGFKKKVYQLFYIILVLGCQFLIDSRTGQLIMLLQIFVLLSIRFVSLRKASFYLLVPLIVFSVYLNINSDNKSTNSLLPDSELTELIKDPQTIFLYDKSWVQRKLQQQKCLQIFQDNMVLGIGPLNFVDYNVGINTSSLDVDKSVLSYEYTKSDRRSSHNSYYQLLAENGLVGFCLFFLILFYPLKSLINHFSDDNYSLLLFISLLGGCLNLYMLSGLWGSNTWIMIGLALGYRYLIEPVKGYKLF